MGIVNENEFAIKNYLCIMIVKDEILKKLTDFNKLCEMHNVRNL
jgi:hypothetical protein